jgi:sugar phosphate permease
MSLIEYGTIFGGMILGHITDLTYGKRSPVILISLIISCLIILYLAFNMKTLYENQKL